MEKTQERIAIESVSEQMRDLSARLETLRHLLVAKGFISNAEFDRVLEAVTAQGMAGVEK
jgi:hypothetical protein